MRNSYIGFYSPNESELKNAWKSENTIFIFDTNVFLNIYSYKESTRKDFFNSLKNLKNNIWIPFHVGLEYQRNRLKIISKEKSLFRNLYKELSEIKNSRDKLKDIENRFPELIKDGDDLFVNISKEIDKYEIIIKKLDENQPCVRSHDPIREKLNNLFTNQVGKEPTQEYIDNLELEGDVRYENKIPPGFKDLNKGEESFQYGNIKYKNKYGDLIIWNQILDYAKENKQIHNVIFITDDTKTDWWFSIDSGGKKIVGPDAALINEINKIENINLFHMYTASEFLSSTNKYYSNVNISNDSIVEMKNLENHKAFSIKIKDSYIKEMLKNELVNQLAEMNEVDKWSRSSSLDEIEKWERLSSLNEIEKLKRLSGLDEIEKLKRLSGLDEIEKLKRLSGLDEIEKLKRLSGLDEIEKLKRLSDLDEIEKLKRLSGLDEIEKLKKLSNLDETTIKNLLRKKLL